jgi:hypothetical protein
MGQASPRDTMGKTSEPYIQCELRKPSGRGGYFRWVTWLPRGRAVEGHVVRDGWRVHRVYREIELAKEQLNGSFPA